LALSEALQSIKEVCDMLNISVETYQYGGAEKYKKWDERQMLDKIQEVIQVTRME